MKVGICAIIKDCPQANLIEWIEWHQKIGVDYFFIYDNESAKPISEITLTYTNVFVTPIAGKIQQLPAYNSFLELHRKNVLPQCDWVAFIDDDEFICIADGLIKPFLEKQKGSAVGLNWVTFGSDGDVAKQEPQMLRYTKHIPLDKEVNKHIKSIVRPHFVSNFVNPHFAAYKMGACYDVHGNKITGAYAQEATDDIAWINHYYCKSLEEFKVKVAKGRVDCSIPYDLSMYDKVNSEATETSAKIIDIERNLRYPGVICMRNDEGKQALVDLIQEINKTQDTSKMTMVEIGSYGGDSTVVFAQYFKKVISIDPFVNDYDPKDPTCQQADFSLVYEKFKEMTAPYPNIEHLRMFSDDAISLLSDIDFVYIDGCHTYEQVKKDIQNYLPLIPKNCYIGGHDYLIHNDFAWLGIKKAVNEVLGYPDHVYMEGSWLKKKGERKKPIVLITPTGGRAKQIRLCAKWMQSQIYTGEVIWILVDDCIPQTANYVTPNFREGWTIIQHTPTPAWTLGQNTQSRNIQAGLNQIPQGLDIEGIFIIEDDDYYSPKYLEVMVAMLKNYDLCGEKRTMYYNVQCHVGRRCSNMEHSSLFQTAFKPTVIPHLEKILSRNHLFIDIELFKLPVSINLFEGLDLAVGIKGMPGRAGLGTGHSVENYPERIRRESKKLEEYIGKDASFYEIV